MKPTSNVQIMMPSEMRERIERRSKELGLTSAGYVKLATAERLKRDENE